MLMQYDVVCLNCVCFQCPHACSYDCMKCYHADGFGILKENYDMFKEKCKIEKEVEKK